VAKKLPPHNLTHSQRIFDLRDAAGGLNFSLVATMTSLFDETD
jgi:hypothetical protein